MNYFKRILLSSVVTVEEYSQYKREFVEDLYKKAMAWRYDE